MSTEIVLESLDEVPEALRGHFEEADGKFRFQPQGFVGKDALEAERKRLDEFRTNNRKLKAELDKFHAELGNLSPAEVKERMAELESLRDKIDAANANSTPEEIEKLAAKKAERAIADREKILAAERTEKTKLAEQLKAAQLQLDKAVIGAAVRGAAIGDDGKPIIWPTALEETEIEAFQVFTVVDGRPVAHDEDGNLIMGIADPNKPLTPREWLLGLKDKKPHRFPAAVNGGGATGATGKAGGSRRMPRSEFDALSPAARMKHIQDGGDVID